MKYGSLTYNTKSEEGIVKIAPDFDSIHGVIKLDILGDWISQLNAIYDIIHKTEYPSLYKDETE